MPLQLLPASAKAFAKRSKPNVVLNATPEPWLTLALKRINRGKRPLNSVAQHRAFLEDVLAGDGAIWLLAALILPTAPQRTLNSKPSSESRKSSDNGEDEDEDDDTAMLNALARNYKIVNITGYCVHIDMVSQDEVAFKLSQESIDALVAHHHDVYCVDEGDAYAQDWPEKEKQLEKLHQDFVQAVNSYVFRTSAATLDGLDDDGAGEITGGRSDACKRTVLHMFGELLPPPPKIVDVYYMAGPGAPVVGHWVPQYTLAYAPPLQLQQMQQPHQQPLLFAPFDPWRGVVPVPVPVQVQPVPVAVHPTPSPSLAGVDTASTWSGPSTSMGTGPGLASVYTETLGSPTLAYPQPPQQHQYPEQPEHQHQHQNQQHPEHPQQHRPQDLHIPALPLPSQLIAQHGCSTTAGGKQGGNTTNNYGYWYNGDLVAGYLVSGLPSGLPISA